MDSDPLLSCWSQIRPRCGRGQTAAPAHSGRRACPLGAGMTTGPAQRTGPVVMPGVLLPGLAPAELLEDRLSARPAALCWRPHRVQDWPPWASHHLPACYLGSAFLLPRKEDSHTMAPLCRVTPETRLPELPASSLLSRRPPPSPGLLWGGRGLTRVLPDISRPQCSPLGNGENKPTSQNLVR